MSFQCMVANANDILVEPHCTPSLPGKRRDINGGPPLVNDDGGVLPKREQREVPVFQQTNLCWLQRIYFSMVDDI